MINMDQVETVKMLHSRGKTISEIARRMDLDRKTIRKHAERDDFSESVSINQHKISKLDDFKTVIAMWLDDDLKMRVKQRHTAKRIHQRLTNEYPDTYTCSYPLVQRYVKELKREKGKKGGYLEQIWHPAEAQADFGTADFIENGIQTTKKYLCLTFPQSNAAFMQVFNGETAECVCQGLKDIATKLKGFPRLIVFDNATGVGRKIADSVKYTDLFRRFALHYGFEVRFCNPYSGHEKGNVENKVGYLRRNMFVPIQSFADIEEYNLMLLNETEADHEREHYKKHKTIQELFETDRQALLHLPAKPFSVERFERHMSCGYGKVCLDGVHYYSSAPEYALQELTVGISAHWIRIYDQAGGVIARHKRVFGSSRSDSIDYSTTLESLIHHPNAWKNSGFRQNLTDSIKETLDVLPKDELRVALRAVKLAVRTFSLETALASLELAVKVGRIDAFSIQAACLRISGTGLTGISDPGPDLSQYDHLLGKEVHI